MRVVQLTGWQRIVVAVLMPLLAAGLQWLLWRWVQPFAWLFFYPAVFVSSRIGGWRGGLPAIALAAVLAVYFFIPPRFSWSLEQPPQLVAVAVFVGLGAVFCYVHERLWRAKRREAEALAAARLATEQLEQRVRERTGELERVVATLQASEARFSGLVDSAMDAIVSVDEAQRIILFNPAAERMFGYPAAMMLGGALERLMPERFRATHPAKVAQFATADQPAQIRRAPGELTGLRADGTEFPVEAAISRADVLGHRVLTAVVRDISARKASEAALRASEEKFAAAFREAPVMVAITDLETARYLDFNEELVRQSGFSREELTGHAAAELGWITWADRQRLVAALQEGGRISGLELTLNAKDGRTLCGLVNGERITIGGRVFLLTVTMDVTERRRAEAEVRAGRAKLEAALEAMTDAVFITDREGRFVDFNTAFATCHRFRSKAECARTFAEYPSILDVFFADGTPAPLEMWAVPRALRGEQVVNAEYRLRRKDTGETWIGSYSFGPIRDSDGRIVGAVVSGRDITAQKEADAALRASEELVAGVFNSIVSHLAVLDADGTIIAVNEAWRRFTAENPTADALPKACDVGANYLAVCRRGAALGAEGAQAAHDGIVEVLAGRAPRFTLEYPCHAPHENRWFMLVATPLGRGGRAVVNHLNITERKRVETVLRQRLELQDQLTKIMETVPGMVFAFRLRPDGTACMPFCTPVVVDLLGFRPEELQRDFSPAFARMHPEDLGRVQASIAESARLLTPWRETLRIRHPQKGERWCEGHAKPLREPDGGTLWHGFVQDVTERMQAEVALRRSEERFAGIFHSSPTAIAISRLRDGCFLDVNEAFTRLYGYEREELVGHSATELQLWAEPKREVVMAELRERRRILNARLTIRRKDGEQRGVLASLELTDFAGEACIVGGLTDVTELRRAEVQLRESEERFRMVVEHAPEAIFVRTGDRFTYLNEAAVRLFGAVAKEDLLDQPVIERFHPSQREQVEQRIGQMDDAGVLTPTSDRLMLRLDGSVVDGLLSAVPFTYRGQPSALVFLRDITERKRAEAALARTHRDLELLLGSVAEGILGMDGAGCMTFVNPMAARILGYEAAELVGRNGHEVWHHTRADGRPYPEAECPIMSVLRTGVRVRVDDEVFWRKDGTSFPVEYSATPVEEQGRVVGVVVTFSDITERQRAEAALRESEARFRQIAETINEVFWITDPAKERVLYISPAYEKIWGRTCESLDRNPRDWFAAIHEEDRSRVMTAVFTKQATGEYDETYRIVRPDGTVRWVHDQAFPLRDHAGRVYRVLGTAEDITERRKLERQYRQAQKMEAIGTLAGGIAHDFNNILGAILGFAELIKLQGNIGRETASHVDDILRAARRATALVRQILTFSRQENPERRPVQLGPIVQEAVALLRASIPTTIEFAVEIAPATATVLAEPSQVHQIVMNLGTNAWHAMRERPGRLSVTVADCVVDPALAASVPQLRPGLYVRVAVGDTGKGMDRATLERIFDPFFTTKAPGEGTGLGLSVVHGIVQGHDGAITVESRPGQGTQFQIYFPAAPEIQPAAVETETAVPAGRGERILVVDDEEMIVRIATAALQQFGYQVTGFTEVGTALAAVRQDPTAFDLLYTDQNMPVMTGVDFARRAHELRADLPVLLATGFSAELTPDKVHALGVAEILLKPVAVPMLRAAVRRVLDRRNSHSS